MDEEMGRHLTGLTAILCFLAGILLAFNLPEITYTTRVIFSVMIGGALFIGISSYQRNWV